jgi:type I restriction enzyme S subunit
MNWEKKQVSELCDLIIDCVNRTAPVVEFPTQYKMIRTTNVRHGRLNLDEVRYVTDDIYQKWIRRGKPEKGDVILTREAPLGEVAIVKTDDDIFLGQRMVMYRTSSLKCNNFFLYYSMLAPFIQGQLRSSGTGSTVEHIKVPDTKTFLVNLPPLSTQRKIASILSAYDDLIENNLKRIKLLEEKAFVTYKGIVSSEKLEAVQLKDVAVVNESTLKTNSNIDTLLYVDIASVSTGSIDNKTEYDLKEAPGRAKRILKHEDIIWSCVRPNRKSYSFVWKPEENLIASTGFAVITSKEIPATFLYQQTIANEFVNYLENHAKGATYPAVTATDFAEALINIPPASIMKEYHEAVYPCFELKSILQKQNTKLREARDILLPRLMNGQIEVS